MYALSLWAGCLGGGPAELTPSTATVTVTDTATEEPSTPTTPTGSTPGDDDGPAVVVIGQTLADGTADLYAMLDDGSRAVPIARTPGDDRLDRISDSGRAVVETVGATGSAYGAVNLDGTEPAPLTTIADAADLRAILPDRFVFDSSTSADHGDVFAVSYDGHERFPIADTSRYEEVAAVTPDHRLILSTTAGTRSDPADLVLVEPDGTGAVVLADDARHETVAEVLESGKLLFYREPDTSWSRDLYVIDLDGSGEVALAEPSDGDVVFQAVHPGGWVVYALRRDTGHDDDLYAVRLDGSMTTHIASDPEIEYYQGATASGAVLFARFVDLGKDYRYDLHLVEPDGSNPRLLTEGAGFETFSADGTEVLFQRETRPGQWDLFAIHEDGTHERPILSGPGAKQVEAVTASGGVLVSVTPSTKTASPQCGMVQLDGSGFEILGAGYCAGITRADRVLIDHDGEVRAVSSDGSNPVVLAAASRDAWTEAVFP